MFTDFYQTYFLLIAVGIFSLKGFNDNSFVEKNLFIPYRIKHNNEWYRFTSHAFLHGDIGHLFFNGFTIFNFGPFLEDYLTINYGFQNSKIIFWLFVIAALFGSSIISYFRHKDNPNYRALGLSGVVSAVLFAFIMIAPKTELNLMFIPIPITAYVFGLIYLAFEIYSDRNRKSGIAHDAHIGGAIVGILFILFTNIELVIENFNSLLP
jgi:membrane associated rhomboid family serine protease